MLAALVDTFAAYISRVYSEFGKILPREVQDNLDEWEEKVEPLIGLTREHAAFCAAVLQQLTLGVFALAFGAVLFDRAPACGTAYVSRDRAGGAGRRAGGGFLQPDSAFAAVSRTPRAAGRRGWCGPFACCFGS